MMTMSVLTEMHAIIVTLTPHEAYALYLAIDASKNATARSVDRALQRYAKQQGVGQ